METWKPVVGYEGIYEVSDAGRVKRIGAWADGRKTKPIGLLRIGINRRYCRAVLHNKNAGKQKHYQVHRLVMAAFVGPVPFDYVVNHKNGNKHDNRLENLEYVTHSENQLHSYRILKNPHFKGSGSGTAKIKEEDAIAIRALRRRGWKLKKLSEEFALSVPTVCWICKNKAWRHI